MDRLTATERLEAAGAHGMAYGTAPAARKASRGRRLAPLAGGTLFLLAASAFWVESDLYRYVLAVALVWAAAVFVTAPHRRLRLGTGAWLCFAFSAYVAARLGYAYLVTPAVADGHSEGLYLFPLVFSTLGYGLFLWRGALARLVPVFFLASAGFLAASTDYGTLFGPERQLPLYHSNAIHGAVSAGIIFIAAAAWLSHLLAGRAGGFRRGAGAVAVALAVLTVVLSGLNVLCADSKGVWLAFVPVAALAALLALVRLDGRRALGLCLAGLAVLGIVVFAAHQRLEAVAGETLRGAVLLVSTVLQADDRLGALHGIVAAESIPAPARLRLELWLNAWQVWSENLVFGAGARWDDLFRAARYEAGGYTTLHNGVLEIAVRYGLVGLVLLAAILAWLIAAVLRAERHGLVPPAAFSGYLLLLVFFVASNGTNSNSHYAFGEAFVLLAGGFGFYCHFLLAYHGGRMPAAGGHDRAVRGRG